MRSEVLACARYCLGIDAEVSDCLHKRVLLKLSGEALSADAGFGIEPEVLSRVAEEVQEVLAAGVEVGIVVGGGNIFRGVNASIKGIDRVSADYMGMMATVINSLALQAALERLGVTTRVMSAISMNEVCEPFITRKARKHLEEGRVVIFACGTGNPYFTTDTASALRAKEIGADLILKATKVDGVYDRDPQKDPAAVMFNEVSYLQVLKDSLQVMDATAISLCMEEKTPIRVFNIKEAGNIPRAILKGNIGTLVTDR